MVSSGRSLPDATVYARPREDVHKRGFPHANAGSPWLSDCVPLSLESTEHPELRCVW